jgi:hypothetical protein
MNAVVVNSSATVILVTAAAGMLALAAETVTSTG